MINCGHNICMQQGQGCSLEGRCGDLTQARSARLGTVEYEYKLLESERDALKAEVERLSIQLVEARDEIKQLKWCAKVNADEGAQYGESLSKDRDRWKEAVKVLVSTIKEALAPLGKGHCKTNSCEGCACEVEIAIESLEEGLAAYDAALQGKS